MFYGSWRVLESCILASCSVDGWCWDLIILRLGLVLMIYIVACQWGLRKAALAPGRDETWAVNPFSQ